MSEFFQWLMSFVKEFKFLAIVLPWERAIRVRCGNRVKLWEPGAHIRLPFVDEIQLLNTRLRVANAGTQTLTTRDGHTLTVGVTIGFSIRDPALAMLRMHHPEASCAALATGRVAEIVAISDRAALLPSAIEASVFEAMQREPGYEFEFVRVTDFAYAKAFRILNENSYRQTFNVEDRKL